MQRAPLARAGFRYGPALTWLLDNGLYVVTALLFGACAAFIPNFLSLDNFVNILSAAAVKGMIAAGFTFALIAGFIDVSVIGVLAVASVASATLFQRFGLGFVPSALLTVLIALAAAALNTWLIHSARLNAFVATVATSGLFFGLALAFTNGNTIPLTRAGYTDAVLARPLGVPLAIWLTFLVYGVGYMLLNHTRLGAHLYALGINASAARLNGVRTGRVTFVALSLSATITAVAAIVATGRAGVSLLFGTTLPGFDVTEIFVIALLGGASLFGGSGRIERNLVAALFLATLLNGLQLLNAPSSVWLMLKGVAFVAAIVLDTVRQRQLGA